MTFPWDSDQMVTRADIEIASMYRQLGKTNEDVLAESEAAIKAQIERMDK
jgi:hypothetical protein